MVLKLGFTAGTKALDTYKTCCDKFGFKTALSGNFARQKLLYAKNATREGYGIWMIAHSSLNESYNTAKESGRKWYNIFVGPDKIRKIWFRADEYVQDDSIRVCFAKEANGAYVFKGVYKPVKADFEEVFPGKTEWVRTFERISVTYPFEENKEAGELPSVVDKCLIEAFILEQNKTTTVNVDLSLRPFQKELIGKKVGDSFKMPKIHLTYKIKRILTTSK